MYTLIVNNVKSKLKENFDNIIKYKKLKETYLNFFSIFYNSITNSGQHIFKCFLVKVIFFIKHLVKQVLLKQTSWDNL